jgi:gustatory receptor
MFLISSTINDEAIKPLAVFRTLPTEGWFPETERLCNQIQRNTIALSGKKFFHLTRGIIITIAGTIM